MCTKLLAVVTLFLSFNGFAAGQQVLSPYPATDHQTALDTLENSEEQPAGKGLCVPYGPRVALTFDDGPYPGRTDGILSILRSYNVPATFFVLGERVKMFPKTFESIVADGHEVGVHTYNHPDLLKLSPEQRNQQILKGWQAMHDASPNTPILYWRAPYGNVPKTPIDEVRRLGLKHIGWTIDTLDWTKETSEMWRTRVAGGLNTHAKQIILMHDHAAVSGEQLENLIVSLREYGYQLVSISMFDWPTCPTDGVVDATVHSSEKKTFHFDNTHTPL